MPNMCTLSELVAIQREQANFMESLSQLRVERRADPSWEGCDFCFGTAWGELDDGTVVPCPDHNGLC
jgi:hypothetical protein